MNVLNDKYYFTIDNDLLVSIDKNGNITETNIRGAKKITESGVYTSVSSSYGLMLVSLEGKTLHTYDELRDFQVYILFEQDNYVYFRSIDDNQIYRMSVNDGTYSLFVSDTSLFENCMM